jgi:hypothetical protein
MEKFIYAAIILSLFAWIMHNTEQRLVELLKNDEDGNQDTLS